jgi:cytochrome c peroxidase
MHDGRFKTLNEVVKHYNSGVLKSSTLSKELLIPMNLSDNQRTELVSFLKTLSDKDFLFNQKYSYPK